ncbi:MAG: recombinase RecA [Planctomycetaceae bacterium]|nr:recombinase RecA [Planctomycetaceae bacterium]
MTTRLETGVPQLDRMLGGGLLPGTQTVVVGATGIGKTQLGLQFLEQGQQQEGQRGILFDMTTRGDSQNHSEYARRLFDWELTDFAVDGKVDPADVWDAGLARRDYVHIFRQSGRQVSIGDMEPDDWREWKTELARKLDHAIAFFYGNFVHGVRRCVIDGIEPVDRASDSFQMRMIEYIVQQILRKESSWLARDLFRAAWRSHQEQVEQLSYETSQLGCLVLETSHQVMLDDLISRPIASGDLLSNANTVILMGKIRQENGTGRGLYIAKHRGSACEETIAPYRITERGLEFEPAAG